MGTFIDSTHMKHHGRKKKKKKRKMFDRSSQSCSEGKEVLYRNFSIKKSGVVVNALNCIIVASEFESQARYYVHFSN